MLTRDGTPQYSLLLDGADTPIMNSALRKWLAPVALLLSALFCQNAGLYSATCVYLQWADAAEGDAAQHNAASAAAFSSSGVGSSSLEDPLHRLLKGSQLAESLEGLSWAPEVWVDLLTDCVIISLLIQLVRMNDLKSWTHLALTATVLAILKGVLAWSTVLPDATGWMGCQRRLGPHGLMYFRKQNSEGLGTITSVVDIFLLTVQSLWLLGRAAPQQLCADTLFCCSTSTTVLVCLGAYDAVSVRIDEVRRERRSAILGLTGLILCAILTADVALAVGSKLHYSVDVLLAIPLTFLVYGNPAIAMCAREWAERDTDRRPVSMNGHTFEPDLGMVAVEPCCFPFGKMAGKYFLRQREVSSESQRFRWTEDQQRVFRQKKVEMTGKLEAMRRRCSTLADSLEAQRDAAQRWLLERQQELDKKLEDAKAEQDQQISDEQERLDGELKALEVWKSAAKQAET